MQVSLKDCKALKIESWSTLVNVACNPPQKKKTLLVGIENTNHPKVFFNTRKVLDASITPRKLEKKYRAWKVLRIIFEILIPKKHVREIPPKRLLLRTFAGDISHKLSSFGVTSTRKKTCGRFMRTVASRKRTCL